MTFLKLLDMILSTNCLSVFDPFVGLTLKGLIHFSELRIKSLLKRCFVAMDIK